MTRVTMQTCPHNKRTGAFVYSISFFSPETRSHVRAMGAFETERRARNYAAKLARSFKEVVVWRGHPGEMRVCTFNPLCDAERFGDPCVVCSKAGAA